MVSGVLKSDSNLRIRGFKIFEKMQESLKKNNRMLEWTVIQWLEPSGEMGCSWLYWRAYQR